MNELHSNRDRTIRTWHRPAPADAIDPRQPRRESLEDLLAAARKYLAIARPKHADSCGRMMPAHCSCGLASLTLAVERLAEPLKGGRP